MCLHKNLYFANVHHLAVKRDGVQSIQVGVSLRNHTIEIKKGIPSMNTEILVIEDDDLVRQGIVDILELKGWNAVAAKSCSEALVRIRGEEYMLYVLDMKLPDGNGIMLCREIRRYTDNPILFLSAYDSEEFIVEGFEFIARIKALLRRTGMQNGKKVKKGIKSGKYELDLQKQILQKDGVRIDLTRTEYQILCSLLANAPNLVAREFLLDTIWDFNENYIDDNTLSVHMNRLRKKLTAENEQDPIETKRGVGYAWTLKAEDVYDEI